MSPEEIGELSVEGLISTATPKLGRRVARQNDTKCFCKFFSLKTIPLIKLKIFLLKLWIENYLRK